MKKKRKESLDRKALNRLRNKGIAKEMKELVGGRLDMIMEDVLRERTDKIRHILTNHAIETGYSVNDPEYVKAHCEHRENDFCEVFLHDGVEILRVTMERDLEEGEVYFKYEY